jgi:hypothetical protein
MRTLVAHNSLHSDTFHVHAFLAISAPHPSAERLRDAARPCLSNLTESIHDNDTGVRARACVVWNPLRSLVLERAPGCAA